LQTLAASENFDALIALGCVIKGDTYHFEVVCNESAAGITRVGLDMDVSIGNGVLTVYSDEQAVVRAEQKGYEAAQAAVEMALLQEWALTTFGEE
jgi:6,7-dimethyl-8-ribityllumazine synthase